MGSTYREKVGDFELNEVLRPYYDDVHYASNPSSSNSQNIRSKTPAQLLDKFDPLPSDEIQKKIDYYFKPYSMVNNNTKKFMTFIVNEREDRLFRVKEKLKNAEAEEEDM